MSKPISQLDTEQEPVNAAQQSELEVFIKHIGASVQQARLSQGLSRRVLSERSGVSSRTIVLLETGVGNISITLLFRIAQALGHSVEWFVSSATNSDQNALRVAQYFQDATPRNQQRVLNILAASEVNALKQKRIGILGLRGAGKSTLGGKLGAALSLPFVELNQDIERLSGLSIQEVMNLYGQDGYRRFERQALKDCVESHSQLVLTVSGGLVSDPDTHAFLLKHFHTIWLKAAPEEHMERVKQQGDKRPMAGNPQAMEQLRSILIDREPLYALSDDTVDTSDKSVDSALRQLQQSAERLLNLGEHDLAAIGKSQEQFDEL